MRFLDQFSAVLLDMNGTYMFGHDRLGPEQDYWKTYRSFGGTSLGRDGVMNALRDTCNGILRDYENPSKFENFPSLAECFIEYAKVSERDLSTLERVFAAHEMGEVSSSHATFLRNLCRSHCLGVVSNICAKPGPWLEYFQEIGLLSTFSTLVFSSDGRAIKPSPRLFEQALDALPAHSRVLFVGDSLERDVVPAKALGLSTAFIDAAGSKHPSADVVIEDLTDLSDLVV